MPLDRQRKILARHAIAVVRETNERLAAIRGHNLNAPRPGIDRIVQQFTHHAGWPLDDLTGSNLVDDGLVETVNGHGCEVTGIALD